MKKNMSFFAWPKKTNRVIKKETVKNMYRYRQLYLMLIPAVLTVFVFSYLPLPGLLITFQDFKIYDKFLRSEWVGLENIIKLFARFGFLESVGNTLLVSFLNLLTFPAPIILALLINEVRNLRFKKIVQTSSYLPHFLSWISVTGIMHSVFGRDGIVNDFRIFMGAEERIVFLGKQDLFVWFVLFVGIWKEIGWGTIIHLANLSSINPELYEAAEVDGAKHLQKTWYITLPHMIPTVVLLLIFQMGTIFNSNFEFIYGMQNPYIDFEVISTFIYKSGLQQGNYSMATAAGFTQGLVALLLVVITNKVAKMVGASGIW